MRPSPPLYLHAIVRAWPEQDPRNGPSLPGHPLFAPCRSISDGALTAFVSDLELPEGVTFESLLRAPDSATNLVLHHHQVLDALAQRQTVLPLRFGTLLGSDDGVRASIASGRDAYLEMINDIDGAAEWGLKIFCDCRRLGERVSCETPEVARLQTEIADGGAGRAFFLQRRMERLVDEARELAIGQCIDITERRLESVSRRTAKCQLQPAETHGRSSAMIANTAFLVPHGHENGLIEIVADLRSTFSCRGFAYEVTGPWPPYSFIGDRPRGDGHVA
jgi:hypothetical protein